METRRGRENELQLQADPRASVDLGFLFMVLTQSKLIFLIGSPLLPVSPPQCLCWALEAPGMCELPRV